MRRGRRRVREEVRKTCPSLHDPVQSRQRVSATTTSNRRDVMRRISRIREHRITTPISVSGESNYSWHEGTFPLERNIIPLPRRGPSASEGGTATLAATIPVLNYHKPLNPARTKLFLCFCPSETAISREYGFSILNVLFIFHVFVGGYCDVEDVSVRASPVAAPLGSRQNRCIGKSVISNDYVAKSLRNNISVLNM